jgi:glycine cleavage system H lipoate-binding protein
MVVILLLVAIAIMVLVDIFVIRARSAKLAGVKASPSVFNRKSLIAPEGYYFSKGHVWATLMGGDKIKAGIDDFVIHALGKILISDIAPAGSKVKKGDVMIKGKFDSKTVSFLAPVDGTIDSINKDIIGKVISDPYNNDWGVVIKTGDVNSALLPFLMGNTAVNWMKNEFKKLKDFLVMNSYKPGLAGVTMYDGGNVVEGAIANLDENSMKDFESMFLSL